MRLAAKNQRTSFYFLLQRKCFCHIVLHPWFEGMSSTKSSRLFLVPFTRAFPVFTSTASHPRPTIPFLSLNSCPSDCWAGQHAQHCVGNKVCSDQCSTHSTAPVSKRVEKRGSDTQTDARLQTMAGTTSTDHSVHLLGWEAFHGIFKNTISPGLNFSPIVSPRMSYAKCWALSWDFLS